MMPEEVIQAAQDLKATYTLPVHSSKFPLANHPWDEPLIRVTNAAEKANYPLLTPKIGEVVSLDKYKKYNYWWEGLD